MSEFNIQDVVRIIEERVGTLRIEIKGDFKLIKRDLEYIKEQTTRTNGRVNDLEGDIESINRKQTVQSTAIHDVIVDAENAAANKLLHCPYRENIRRLEDTNLTIQAIKKHSDKQLVRLSIILGVLITILGIITYFT